MMTADGIPIHVNLPVYIPGDSKRYIVIGFQDSKVRISGYPYGPKYELLKDPHELSATVRGCNGCGG